MPQKITAEFEIVTPMFLGDAHSDQLADVIRPPSLKGALRFWWRALAWPRIRTCTNSNEEALTCIHAEEASLFGSAGMKGKRQGQAKFLIRTHLNTKKKNPDISKDWPSRNTGSGYLGLGLFESGSHNKGNYQAARDALTEGQSFSVEMTLHPRIAEKEKAQLITTLQAFGLFGGLGGRGQRRGFGSVALTSLDGESIRFGNIEEHNEAFMKLMSPINDISEPPFSALSSKAGIRVFGSDKSAKRAHELMGQAFKDHRGQESTPKGPGFGLPLADVDNDARRASPLLFHVHPIGSQYQGMVLHLPTSIFHPKYPHPDMTPVYKFMQQEVHV